MGHFKVNPHDLFFILRDQLNYGSLCSLDRYKELDEKMLDLLVTEAIHLAEGLLDPLQEIGEKWGSRFDKGEVFCPDGEAPQPTVILYQPRDPGWSPF